MNFGKMSRKIAARADSFGLAPHAIRARLLASDVRSRRGDDVAAARLTPLDLHAAAQPWPALARRAAPPCTWRRRVIARACGSRR